MKTLDERAGRAMAQAQEMVKMGFMQPHLITYGVDGKQTMAIIIADTRADMVQAARNIVEETEAETCLLVHECWLASPKPDENYTGAPRHHPSAVDALVVYGETRSGETTIRAVGVKTNGDRRSTFVLQYPPATDAVCTWNLFGRTTQ